MNDLLHRPGPSTASRSSLREAGATPRHTAVVLPVPGSLPELLRLLGGRSVRCEDEAACPPIPVLRLQPEAVLLHEGSRGHTLYVVRSGSFKCVRTLEDGYEQVLSFAQQGELLGSEALHAGTWRSSAIALEYATVYAIAASELHDLQHKCPPLEEAIRQGLSRQLVRATEAAGMTSAVASEARLSRFLLWLSSRMAEAGQSPLRLRLRMSRRDIASLLGLAHETVSRSFTLLADSGCLHIDNREIEILDIEALRDRAHNTRGLQTEAVRRRQGPTAAQPEAPGAGWWGAPGAALSA